jgi:hypothetical protein
MPFPSIWFTSPSNPPNAAYQRAYYMIDEVSVVPITPFIDQGDNGIFICSGDSVSLSDHAAACGDGPYLWTSSDPEDLSLIGEQNHQTVTVVPPIGVTTYRVSVFANGCELYDEITIYTLDAPLIEGPESACDTGTQICVTNMNSMDTVLWELPSGVEWAVSSVNCITVSDWGSIISDSIQVDVTLFDTIAQCGRTSTLWVTPCCVPDTGSTIFYNDTITIPTGTAQTWSGALAINGVLTINGGGTLIMSNAQVRMGQFARIDITPGSGLTLNDSTDIRACMGMHDGIWGDTCRFTMHQGAHIEDALIGVHINRPISIKVDSCSFNRNSVHFQLEDDYYDRLFSHLNMACNAPLADPAFGPITKMAIKLITPNGSLKRFGYCSIRDAENGIYSFGSSTILYSDTLRNIKPDCVGSLNMELCNEIYGNGLVYDGVNLTHGLLLVTDCLFDSCQTGVRTRSLMVAEFEVRNSVFSNNFYGVVARKREWYYLHNNTFRSNFLGSISELGEEVDISGNFFLDNGFGVISRFEGQEEGVHIYDNVFDNSGGEHFLLGHNIRVQNSVWGDCPTGGPFILSPCYNVFIHHNTMTNALKGIYVQDVHGARITDNDIHLRHHDNTPPAYQESMGIWAEQCIFPQIGDNTVWSDGYGNNWRWWDTGIRTDMCALALVMCDSTRNVHNGFYNSGPAHTTWMYNNVMDSTHLRGIVQNYGVLGQQGTPTNPSDIQWAGTFEAAHTDAYYTEVSQPFYRRDITQGSPFWPIGFNATDFPNNQVPYRIDLDAANNGATSSYDCPIDFRANGYLHRLALDSINFSGADSIATERLSKLELFRAVCADSILQLDSILLAYVDSFIITDLGQLDTLSRHFGMDIPKSESGKLASAVDLVNTTDTIGSLWKELLIMAFDKWSDDDSTTVISESDSIRLWDIGALCPYQFGPSVYLARTMLFSLDSAYLSLRSECEQTIFIDPSERRGQDGEDTESLEQTVSAQVYPNPTHGILNVRLSGDLSASYMLCVTSIDGRRIFNTTLTESMQFVDLSKLSPGLYIVDIMDQGESVIFKGKFSIAR